MSQAEDAPTTPALTVADLDTDVNHEARILDGKLATHLGMARPTNIRALIEASRTELKAFAGLHVARANPGRKGGRPTDAFYLTEGQALCICALSRAPNAPQVRRALIEAFMELRRRQAKAVLPPPEDPQVEPPRRHGFWDLTTAASAAFNAWNAAGLVTDHDRAMWIAMQAVCDVAGVDARMEAAAGLKRRGRA